MATTSSNGEPSTTTTADLSIDDGTFLIDVKEKIEYSIVTDYVNAGFLKTLIENLLILDHEKPTILEGTIIGCLVKKFSLFGNNPLNHDVRKASISFSVNACFIAKQKGSYKSTDYKPFGIFIIENQSNLEESYKLACKLATEMDVSVTFFKDAKDVNEDYFKSCDLIFISSNNFNSFVKKEIVLFDELNILTVLGLGNDEKKLQQYKHIFQYNDFPMAGQRILIFFDKNFSDVLYKDDLFINDKKASITLKLCECSQDPIEAIAKPEKLGGESIKPLAMVNENSDEPFIIKDVIEGEKKLDESFYVCKSDNEKLDILKSIFDCRFSHVPRSIIYVKDNVTEELVLKLLKEIELEAPVYQANGHLKRTSAQYDLGQFKKTDEAILIACDIEILGNYLPFKDVEYIIFFNGPISLKSYERRGQIAKHTPGRLISLLNGEDYAVYKSLCNKYVIEEKPVSESLEKVVKTLKQLYYKISEDDDEESDVNEKRKDENDDEMYDDEMEPMNFEDIFP